MRRLWLNFLVLFTLFIMLAVGIGVALVHFGMGKHQLESVSKPYLETEWQDRPEDIDLLRERLAQLYADRQKQFIPEIIFRDSETVEAIVEDSKIDSQDMIADEQVDDVHEEKIADTRPKIIIVIDDLGLNRGRLERLANLSIPMTFAFLPYAKNLKSDTQFSHEKGHDIFLHLPMQPIRKTIDPGPNYLRTDMDKAEIIKHFEAAVQNFTHISGFNNHMGSAFTKHKPSMEIILAEAEKRNLIFLDSRTIQEIASIDIAKERGQSILVRDVFIDHVKEPEAIQKQLQLTERVAKRYGSAIAIGHPYPETIDALEEWLKTDVSARFHFITASELYRIKQP